MRQIIRVLFTLRRAALPCCLLFALLGAAGAAQPDKAVYEKAQEQKAEAPGRSGGLGKYSSQGLALLAGIFIGIIISRTKRSAADVKGAVASAPVQPAPPARFVPPPAQPRPSPAEDEELNIPSRSGFYKRR